MAKSFRNVITFGLSGLIGELLVFKQRAGKTIVANRPAKSSKAPSAAMLGIRERFRRAAAYAKSVMGNLLLKAEYAATAKSDQSAFNMAFIDYQKAPEIEAEPDFSTYTGGLGQTLKVSVVDDFKVESVRFTIKDAEGGVVESGLAVQTPNQLDWIYTTTVVNADLLNGKVEVRAWDLPGNETLLEVNL